jgi:hypothetical protein
MAEKRSLTFLAHITAEQATQAQNVKKSPSEGGTYSHELLQMVPQGAKPRIEFAAEVPDDSDYYIRVSASSGKAAHQLDVSIDGKKAALENYAAVDLDPNGRLTRDVDNPPPISWYPGWHMYLTKGKHRLVFSVPESRSTPELFLDAIALQSYKELPHPYVIPGAGDLKAEAEVAPGAN